MTGLMTPEGLWWAALTLDVAWKSAAVLAGAALIGLGLRRAAAATRHLIWFVALAGSLAIAPLSIALPPWPWHVLPSRAEARAQGGTNTVKRRLEAAVLPGAPVPGRVPANSPGRVADDTTPAGQPAGTILGTHAAAPSTGGHRGAARTTPWPAWVWGLGLWLGGAGLVLAGPLMGRFALRKAARGAVVQGGNGPSWSASCPRRWGCDAV